MKVYNKLIRDKIPQIIEASGKQAEISVLATSDYEKALKDKLIEEAQELRSASDEDQLSELADVYEVLDAMLLCKGLTREQVQEQQRLKREERGGFAQRLFLKAVTGG